MGLDSRIFCESCMVDTIIPDISFIVVRYAPIVIIFIVATLIANNFKDMVVQWYIGIGIKRNKKIDELDIFEIDGKKCLLIKINSFRLYFLELSEGDTLQRKLITIDNKTFITCKIVKLGKFI